MLQSSIGIDPLGTLVVAFGGTETYRAHAGGLEMDGLVLAARSNQLIEDQNP